MTAFPFRPSDAKSLAEQRENPIQFNVIKDFADGFASENLPTMAIDYLLNKQDFPEDKTYNPKNDPQLKNYGNFYDLFMFSKSAAETTAIINKLQKNAEHNYSSPWYHIGKITGAFTDPSTALLFTKFGQSAKVFGTAFTGEEFAKQMIEPTRPDDYVPWVVAGGYGLPYIMNRMAKGSVGAGTQQRIIEADKAYHAPPKTMTQEIYEDGKFINPTETRTTGSVGAAANEQKVQPTPKSDFEGERFVKSNLGIFGEDGPWTNVFRLTKSSSKTARKMIADILDTPLLKLKNTKEYGFQATDASIETKLRMREALSIQAMKGIKEQYLLYVNRVQGKTPKTELGINLHNRMNGEFMSLQEFATEVTKTRLNKMQHEVPEVAAAARITQDNVYGPIGKEVQDLGIRKLPIQRELNMWKSILENMIKKGEGTFTTTSKVDGTKSVFSRTEIQNKIKKLEERLIRADKLVADYINIIYIKNAIEKNKALFKDIIREDLQKQGKYINEKKLNQLVDDLSTHFPFIRFEKTKYTDNIDDLLYERYAYNRPRYARSTRARELNLLPETQMKLIDNGFIVSDIFSLMKTYYRQVTPDILFTQKYGDPNGLGYRYIDEANSMTFPGLIQVAQEYNLKAFKAKTKEQKPKIIKERNQVIES